MLKFTDKAGKKRTGILVKCEFCGKEFLTRKSQPNKFCSKQCAHNQYSKNHTIELECAWCKNKFLDKKSRLNKFTKSGLCFCSRKCKDNAQKIGGLEEIMPSHYGTAKRNEDGTLYYGLYRHLFNKDELICARCGYKEFSCVVQIHHIDKDRTNNSKENLIPLCANCHFGLHNNQWKLEELGLVAT